MQQQVGNIGVVHAVTEAMDHLIEHAADHRIVLVDDHRLIAAGSGQCLSLGRLHTEDEDVLLADCLADLDVCAVHRADGQSTVHHELHVAGTGCFLAGDGDLLGNLGGRHDNLSQRYLVVLEEYDLQLVAYCRIVVDHLGDGVDQLDGLFRYCVARCGLGAEDKGARNEIHIRIVLQLVIQADDVQNVQHLALVLVQTLNLYVKDGVHVDFDAVVRLDIIRQTLLVVALDLAQLVEQLLVVRIVVQNLQLGRMGAVAGADLALDQLSQLRVGLTQPAAVCNAVGDVAELGGVDLVEVGEYALLEDLGVQRGYAVDGERACDSQMRHADGIVGNDSQLGDLLEVVREVVPQLLAEALVDFVDDLHNTRHQLLNERYRPALEGLRHNGVVGVSNRLAGDVPGLLPAHVVLVHQDAHQLRNNQSRMGIVDMQDVLVREVFECAVLGLVLCTDVLQGCGNQEILLLETQGLTLAVVILRIEDHGDGFRQCVLLQCLQILTGGEQLHVQCDRALCLPQAQTRDVVGAVAGDRHIIRNCQNRRVIVVVDDQLAVIVEVGVNRAADLDLAGLIHCRNLPNLAGRQPGIRQLDLLAFYDLLLENAVLVADGVASTAYAVGRHAVHVAGSQTAKTAVAQTGISFLLEDVRHLEAHVLQGCGQSVQHTEVVGVVAQAAADKKFHAQVMHLTLSVLLYLILGFDHVLGQCIAHYEGTSLVYLILGSVLYLAGKMSLQFTCNGFFQSGLCVLGLWHGLSYLLT